MSDLKIAESPHKAAMLKLVDEVRAEIESGKCLSLVVMPIFGEREYSVRYQGAIGMVFLTGILMRACMDASEKQKIT